MISKTQIEGCEDCNECLNRAPYFKILSPEELEIMNKDRYSVRYKAGEMILKQGTSATHVLSLIDGIVKIYIEGMGDRNLLLNLQKPWALMGGPGLHTDRKIHYSVSALTDVSICFIVLDNFNKVMTMNCRFANQLIGHVSNQAVILFDKMISLTQKQKHGRKFIVWSATTRFTDAMQEARKIILSGKYSTADPYPGWTIGFLARR